jgi:hypothetical protein
MKRRSNPTTPKIAPDDKNLTPKEGLPSSSPYIPVQVEFAPLSLGDLRNDKIEHQKTD